MHVVLAVFGVLGAAAFWWYRIKYMREAAGEIVHAVAWEGAGLGGGAAS